MNTMNTNTIPDGMPPVTPREKPHWLRWTLAGIASLFLLIIIVSVAAGGGSKGTPAAPQKSTSAPAVQVTTATDPNGLACTALDSAGYCPGDDPAPATKAPATQAPALTVSQQQALDSARSYLSDGQGFSKYGLTQQLTSSAGEGFRLADAQFAIRYLHPDWNAQALASARNYMSDGQGFSRSGLLEQLTSQAGEGFTQAQAQYAVNKVFAG
jgi:hypothetical protein